MTIMNHQLDSQILLTQIFNLIRNSQSVDGFVTLNQIKMSSIPQLPEHEDKYNINTGYFEGLLSRIIENLMKEGYIESDFKDSEDGDDPVFRITDKGMTYIESLD